MQLMVLLTLHTSQLNAMKGGVHIYENCNAYRVVGMILKCCVCFLLPSQKNL